MDTQPTAAPVAASAAAPGSNITVFLCANCARSGRVPSAARPRPEMPDFGWPCKARQVLIPCTGRLQPEHLLKAFEAGSDAVVVVACDEENCHNLEGSRRAKRRVEFVRQLLDEIGLGGARLMMFYLPGSARQDLALGVAAPAPVLSPEETAKRIAAMREAVADALKTLTPNPLRQPGEGPAPHEITEELEDTDDSEE